MKKNIIFTCTECGSEAIKWLGRCPECGEWNSFEEQVNIDKKASTKQKKLTTNQNIPKSISEIRLTKYKRYLSGIDEFDRVVGGGLTSGSITLIGGEPGVGKSTLLMDLCKCLLEKNLDSKVLYVSGEESISQVGQRAKRLDLNSENFLVLNETTLQDIIEQLEIHKPKFFILDSIQTTVSCEIASAAGSVSQVKEVTYEVMNYAKSKNLTCLIVGHVNKEGSLAGPKILEHMVDTVLSFEGDKLKQYRMLRVNKNRFGNTDEVGMFEMQENGLKELSDPSKYFIDQKNLAPSPGRSITAILEGKRIIMVETQSLVVDNKISIAKRVCQGVDLNRINVLLAVMDKSLKISLQYFDTYINIVGGVKLAGRESDLALMASIISSYRNKSIANDTVFLGEVGLTGEVREAPMITNYLKELERLKYKRVVLSQNSVNEYKKKFNLDLIGISNTKELIEILS